MGFNRTVWLVASGILLALVAEEAYGQGHIPGKGARGVPRLPNLLPIEPMIPGGDCTLMCIKKCFQTCSAGYDTLNECERDCSRGCIRCILSRYPFENTWRHSIE
uniref:Uncharacterized protein n=1 Tax=Rhipicephalus appendiculatus TaxID=34631 RepID=A0A131YDH9_RHIAP